MCGNYVKSGRSTKNFARANARGMLSPPLKSILDPPLHYTEKISIPGDESNGTSIQYTLNGDQEDKITVEEAKVKVFLHTRVSSKPVKEHVPVHKKVVKSEKYIHSYVVQIDI